MRSLVSYLLNPFIWFLILSFAGILFHLLKKKLLAKRILITGFILLLIFSTPPLPNLLTGSLEKRYTQLHQIPDSLIDQQLIIFALAAGHTDDSRLTASGQLSLSSLGRLTEAIRLYRQHPGSRLVVSGNRVISAKLQADVAEEAAISLGVDPADIIKLESPTNTLTEAKAYRETFGNLATPVIVTDALHMPRAIYLFEKAGYDPVPAPTNFLVKKGSNSRLNMLPSVQYLRNSASALHEFVGLIAARAERNSLQNE